MRPLGDLRCGVAQIAKALQEALMNRRSFILFGLLAGFTISTPIFAPNVGMAQADKV